MRRPPRRPAYSTRALVLDYIRRDTEPRPTARIIEYMYKMHKVSNGATRAQLFRLLRDGEIERVSKHWYRIAQRMT